MGYAKFDIAEYRLICISDVIFVFYGPENPIKDILLVQVEMLRCHFWYWFLAVVAVLKKWPPNHIFGGKNLKVGLPHLEAEWKHMKDSRSNFWKIFEKWNTLMMKVVVTTGAISRAKLQSNRHHQQTNTQFFYRLDALPVAQPTVSKHWRENITFHVLAYPKLTWRSYNFVFDHNSSWLPWVRLPCLSSALWCQYPK